MALSVREANSVRNLWENVKKSLSFSSGLVISVVPRGGLQIIQPANVSDSLLKRYTGDFEFEDRMSWQTILRRKPMRRADVYSAQDFQSTPFAAELRGPSALQHALSLPVASPLIDGYPGVIHLFRTADEGDFTNKEIDSLTNLIHQFETRRAAQRDAKSRNAVHLLRSVGEESAVSFVIFDSKLKPQINASGFQGLDSHLREQLLDHARRRIHHLNGEATVADRMQVPDTVGDVWLFRLVTFREFPALGDGSFAFLCRQPGCEDWVSVKAQDVSADAELARLIPALKYMQQEFSHGATLVDVARQVHLSPFHFHRRFTELLGLTPKQFLLECQIHEAKAKLLARDRDLAQIANDCGFAHQSHFTSRFKQATGLTPTRWRRMVAERRDESSN